MFRSTDIIATISNSVDEDGVSLWAVLIGRLKGLADAYFGELLLLCRSWFFIVLVVCIMVAIGALGILLSLVIMMPLPAPRASRAPRALLTPLQRRHCSSP
jgi:hypothetical protein